MPRKDNLLKVRISDDLKAEADRLAQEKGETLSVIIREALRQYLDRTPPAPVEAPAVQPPAMAPIPPFPFTSDQLRALQRAGSAVNAERLRKLVDYLETDPEAEARVAEEPEPANGNGHGKP